MRRDGYMAPKTGYKHSFGKYLVLKSNGNCLWNLKLTFAFYYCVIINSLRFSELSYLADLLNCLQINTYLTIALITVHFGYIQI